MLFLTTAILQSASGVSKLAVTFETIEPAAIWMAVRVWVPRLDVQENEMFLVPL